MENQENKNKSDKMEVMTINLSGNYDCYEENYHFCQGREKFIKFGEDNLMPNHTIKLKKAPTHASLLHLKKVLTTGNGFAVDETRPELFDFIKRNKLNRVLDRVVDDFTTHGGFTLETGWDASGTYIAEVDHVDFSFVRCENALKPRNYYLCYDWANYRKYNEIKLPEFNPSLASLQLTQLYNYKNYTQGCMFYPKPDYTGIRFIEFEVLLGEFVFNNLENGMSPSGIFNFKEVPSLEERRLIKANIKKDLTGPTNSGKFIALFSEDKDKAVEFIPLNVDNNANIYTALNNLAVQKVISGHHLSNPAIAGLPSAGGVSFGNELSTSYEYYFNLNIPSYQNPILEVFNEIFRINKLIGENESIKIKQIMPGQFRYDGNILGNALLINEVREDVGRKPVDNGNDFVLPKGGNNALPANPTVQQLPPTMTPVNDISKSIFIQ